MSDSVRDSKFYADRYHLEERERRRRLICNGVFIGYTLILTIGFLQVLFVEAISGYQLYIGLTPYVILTVSACIAWITYHIYSRRIINQFYKESDSPSS